MNNLQKHRISTGTLLTVVASKTGVNVGNLSRIERGIHPPTIMVALKLAAFYEKNLDFIYRGYILKNHPNYVYENYFYTMLDAPQTKNQLKEPISTITNTDQRHTAVDGKVTGRLNKTGD